MYLKNFDDMKESSVLFMLQPANSIYGFILMVCASIIIIMLWALFAPMDDVVKADVLLRPNENVSSVKCITSGQLFIKNFVNDDIVKEGDLLFILDVTAYKGELEFYNNELKKNQNDILINDILLNTISTEEIPEECKESDAYVKSRVYLSELHRYERTISDLRKKLEREKNKPESLKIPQNVLDINTQLNLGILDFESWKNNQKFYALENKNALNTTKNSIESHITELERAIKNSTIFAPISGRVTEITKLNIGDYLIAGEEILRIIPQNEDLLKADIYVDTNYIARIKKGNHVKIKFLGLPPSRYGMIETEVSIVPPDVTYINGNAVFVVEANIANPYLIAKNGQKTKLLPGISAECRIVTDRSTVMQMIMKKLDFIN